MLEVQININIAQGLCFDFCVNFDHNSYLGFIDGCNFLVAVGTIPELVVVPTPAKKEIAQRLGKRKCIVDETTMLSNE